MGTSLAVIITDHRILIYGQTTLPVTTFGAQQAIPPFVCEQAFFRGLSEVGGACSHDEFARHHELPFVVEGNGRQTDREPDTQHADHVPRRRGGHGHARVTA